MASKKPKRPFVQLSSKQAQAIVESFDKKVPEKNNSYVVLDSEHNLILRRLHPKFRKGNLAFRLSANSPEPIRNKMSILHQHGRKCILSYSFEFSD